MRHELGLDRPVLVQYAAYVRGILRGDLGRSLSTHRPVAEDLREFFPATLELALASVMVALLLGVPLGVVSAYKKDRWPDPVGRFLALIGVATPSF